ncbi:hydroquinone glucosyltransferase-like [Impatiens glandulifera]|uniref:hydroquinone glucosyltransferase-like n=1 Tax=Impatiens glandulifera TaxID=253017 RepID=UPI001FB12D26|nr:hydroquinone glucosyltransferase-like [Impatiens glandulifera]
MAQSNHELPHLVLLPSPGMGHIIPLVEFAKRLVKLHNFSVTVIILSDGPIPNAHKAFLDDMPERIGYRVLPQANTDDLSLETRIETRMFVMINRSLPLIRQDLVSIASNYRVVAFLTDIFGFASLEIAKELNISPYIFCPSTAMTLCVLLYLPTLDKEVKCEYKDLIEPVRIPGCIPIHGRDLMDPVQDRKNEAYMHILSAEKGYRMAEGILLNNFHDLEPLAIKALQEVDSGKLKIYPVGPLVKMDTKSGAESECLKWLGGQPTNSVLFVSFGSGGTLTYSQLTELAHGLELSQQRFIWVVRIPCDGPAESNYFIDHSLNDPLSYLPKGFIDRVKGYGLVLPSWGPQAEILMHESTGGFLTHCGWNSTLESVVTGVPLIAWPLYAEQKMNAVLLTDDLKVALRAEADENGLVGRVEVARLVKTLMEGEEGERVRSRMKELKEASKKVLAEDGSSTKALAEVAKKWMGA